MSEIKSILQADEITIKPSINSEGFIGSFIRVYVNKKHITSITKKDFDLIKKYFQQNQKWNTSIQTHPNIYGITCHVDIMVHGE